MPNMIEVWPVTEAALKSIKHPSAGKLRGMSLVSYWPDDAFTTRRLADGDITTKPPVVAIDANMKPMATDPPKLVFEPPAPATVAEVSPPKTTLAADTFPPRYRRSRGTSES